LIYVREEKPNDGFVRTPISPVDPRARGKTEVERLHDRRIRG